MVKGRQLSSTTSLPLQRGTSERNHLAREASEHGGPTVLTEWKVGLLWWEAMAGPEEVLGQPRGFTALEVIVWAE